MKLLFQTLGWEGRKKLTGDITGTTASSYFKVVHPPPIAGPWRATTGLDHSKCFQNSTTALKLATLHPSTYKPWRAALILPGLKMVQVSCENESLDCELFMLPSRCSSPLCNDSGSWTLVTGRPHHRERCSSAMDSDSWESSRMPNWPFDNTGLHFRNQRGSYMILSPLGPITTDVHHITLQNKVSGFFLLLGNLEPSSASTEVVLEWIARERLYSLFSPPPANQFYFFALTCNAAC